MKGQRNAIKEHLEKYGSITSMEAFQLYGVTRLSAVIYDLKKLGYDITTHILMGKTRYGTTSQYAKYTLDLYKERK